MIDLIGENMNQRSFKKIVTALSVFTLSCFLVIAAMCICSCDKIGMNVSDVEKAATNAYFSEVTSLSRDLTSSLADFQADVKEKNIDAMKDKLEKTQSIIDDFNKLDVPQNCEDVQKDYLDGFIQLQNALSNYVQIYSDFINGTIDNSVLQERVAEVQKSYNEGLALLRQADKLASEK